MTSALSTLSLIASIDGTRGSIFESYIPLLKYIVIKKHLYVYDKSQFQTLFKSEFKLFLPSYVLDYIMTKSVNAKLLRKDKGQFVFSKSINEETHIVAEIDASRDTFNTNIHLLLSKFNKFAMEMNKDLLEMTIEGFETLIIENLEYLYRHAYIENLIYNSRSGSQSEHIDLMYIYKKFIESIGENDKYLFNLLLDVSFGFSVSELLFCPEFDNSIDLKDVQIFLDTRLILNLLGAHGEYFRESAELLILSLYKSGAFLKIFMHTYDEVNDILGSCIDHWNDYDPEKAPDVLDYFKKNGKSVMQLELISCNINNILGKLNITKEKHPDVTNQSELLRKLKSSILSIRVDKRKYSRMFMEKSAERDAISVLSIIELRNGVEPKKLVDCEYLFITSSSSLIDSLTNLNIFSNGTIAPCHSEMFLGSLLWLSNRKKNEKINKSFFAAIAKGIQPTNKQLYHTFIIKFKEVCTEKNIDEKTVLSFIEDKLLLDILEKHTFNNPLRLTDEEMRSIINEYFESHIIEEKKKREIAEKERDDTDRRYNNAKGKLLTEKTKRIEDESKISKRSKNIASTVKFGLISLTVLGDLTISYIFSIILSKRINDFGYIFGIALLIVCGCLIKLIKWVRVERSIELYYRNLFISKLNKHSNPVGYYDDLE